MANEDQIQAAQEALINAHNAGDEEAAQRLADHIVSLQSQQAAPEMADRTIGNVAGAAAGAIGGGALGRSLQSGIREEYPNLFKKVPTSPTTPSADAMQRYLNSQVTTQGIKGTVPLDKLAQVAGIPTETITQSQVQDVLRDTKPTPAQRVAKTTPTGGRIFEHTKAAAPKIDLAGLAEEVAPASKSAPKSIVGKAADVAKSANTNVGHMLHGMTNPWAIKTLGNVASGASAGMQGVDAYQRLTDPNQGWIRGAVSGLGAVGSGAAMTRVPALMLPGMAVGAAAPFINEYLDDWAKEHPEAAKKLHLADGGVIKSVKHTVAKPDLLMQGIKASNTIKQPVRLAGGGSDFTPKGKLGKVWNVGEKIFGKVLDKPIEGNKATRMSEALNPYINQKLGVTQSDNYGIHGNRMGGNQFPLAQRVLPHHAETGAVWMTDSPKHSNDIVKFAHAHDVPTIWTTYTGGPDQLKSNKSVTQEIYDAFLAGARTPEEVNAINNRIASVTKSVKGKPSNIFREPFDIRDKFATQELGMDTFERRGALASLLGAGEGTRKGKQYMGMPEYQDILKANRDEMTEGIPTSSVGSRLFSVENKPSEYIHGLHPDYDWAVFGKDKGVSFGMVPQEHAVPDFRNAYKQKFPNLEPHGNAWLGYNKNPQLITEEYLDNLYKAGYAEGGEVQHMAGGKLTGGLATLPKDQQAELQKLEHGYNRFANQPAYQKAEMIGDALSGVPEFMASFHPGYGLGYAGGALYDAATNTGDYGGAAADVVMNAPGILKPIGAGVKAAAPMLRQAMPVVGGLGALGAADAAEAGQGSKLKQIIGGVMDQYAPKAKVPVTPGAPHTYGPQAEGPWMRDYQPAALAAQPPAQSQVPGERFDQHIWDQIREKHRNAQNATDYMMGRTGPNPRQPIQYMGKYRSTSPAEYKEMEQREIETIKMLRKLRGMD